MVWHFVFLSMLAAVTLFVWRHLRRCPRMKLQEHDCVVITGCDSGIGHALASHLARSGVQVVATCLNPSSGNSQTLISLGVQIVRLDLTDNDLEEFGAEIGRLLGNRKLHALVNNAGVCIMGEYDWLTEQQVELVFKVNLGSMRIIRLLMDRIIADKSRIINVTSVNGQIAYPGLSVYCASKFALEGFTDSLAMELAKFGVRVIKVRPADYARITSIMSAQTSHTQRMRQNLSETKKLRYGDYFENYQRLTYEMAGQMSMQSFTGILESFDDALFEMNPKMSYNCGRELYIRVCQMLCILPECCQRFVVAAAFRKILRDQNVSLPRVSV